MRLALLLLLGSTVLFAQQLSTDQTASLISRIAQSRQDSAAESDFREEKHLALMEKPVIETGRLAFLPPNMFRREVPGRSLTVCDGQTLWLYYPPFQTAEKYTLQSNRMLRESLMAMTSGLGLQDLPKNYTVQAYKETDGYRLDLVPRSSALRRTVTRITINLGPGLTAKRLQIDGQGGESSVITFSNERKAGLTPADFTFQPPAGTEITEPLGK